MNEKRNGTAEAEQNLTSCGLKKCTDTHTHTKMAALRMVY